MASSDKKTLRSYITLIGFNKEIFFNVCRLLLISITKPASSEKSFSTLRRSKICFRNTTGKNRLNGLEVMNIRHNLVISTEEIFNELTIVARRIKLT